MAMNFPDNTHLDERELIKRCLDGDEDAWGILYERFYNYIFHLVKGKNYRFTLEDTEDITHEVFMDLVKGLPNFQKKSVLKTYIYTLTLNRVRQHHRKYLTIKRGGTAEKMSLEDVDIDLADPRSTDPEQEAIDSQELGLIRDGVRRLPQHLQDVIDLRYSKGFKYREIARELGIPEGSVGALIQKALFELRDFIAAGTA
ncbi:MAG TPA: sigma-70 family RNA polymerase sigma factor [Firmicutes bacterium]|nr:sigma-70 family RNA polymerase sigma factor [Bacillota bacterium]